MIDGTPGSTLTSILVWIGTLVIPVVGTLTYKIFRGLGVVVEQNERLLARQKVIAADVEEAERDQEKLTRAMRSMARVMHWQAEKLTGEKPPPLDLD